jgi:hypothetical protein
MKRGEDYRPYVEGCECYMDLQASRFPTEKHRIIWAMGYLQGDRATEWARFYRRRMAKEERYRSWRAYKSRLQRDSRVSEKDVDALRKMRDVKYRDDIQEYVRRMKLLNQRVDVRLATIK